MREARNTALNTEWAQANWSYLNVELQHLRLLLKRRILWLRRQWKDDPLQPYQGMVISDAQVDRLLDSEWRDSELRFYREDPEAAAASRLISEAQQELSHQRAILMEGGTPPSLDTIAHLFGLSVFERDVLMLCLAPELDPSFERLYAYAQDDTTRNYATPYLALVLLPGENQCALSLRTTFLPDAPLRRRSLVKTEYSGLPSNPAAVRPLSLDERVFDYLWGVNRPDERLTPVLKALPPALLPPCHRGVVESLVSSLESDTGRIPQCQVNLIGPFGSGKQAVARALCDRLGLELYSIDPKRLPPPGPDLQEILRLLEREAILSQFAVYISGDNDDPESSTALDLLSDTSGDLNLLLVVGALQRRHTDGNVLEVRLSKPDTNSQRALWKQALTGIKHSLDGQVEAIVQQFDFGPEDISQALDTAIGRARLSGNEGGINLDPDDLWLACREQAGWQLDELAQRITPCYTWDDIVLPEETFQLLQEITSQVANRRQVYEAWGFGKKLNRGRGISVLFSGPSGTGKTMAAEILAGHLELDLYRIDLAGVVSKYIGETEKNLRKVFDAAEQSGAILFFDEADALFGKRTEVKDSHDRYANIEVNYLLQRMEDYRGLAILATNMKSALDNAFLRRLRFLVDFPFPDADNRRRVWQKVFPKETPLDAIDYTSLGRLEVSGGNIRNSALNAAFLAAEENEPVRMSHIMQAVQREYSKIDKLVTPNEFGPYYNKMMRQ